MRPAPWTPASCVALVFCSRTSLQAASPSPGRDPSRRRPARHRAGGHALRRPAGRCPGDHLLPAGDHDASASRSSTTTASRAKLKIAPDCPLGLHDLRVRTATGISELRTFSVGALKEINEVEPNNDFAAPAADPDERDGQRRRRQRRRRLLRRRGQEGRADLGRGRGPAAGDQRVRPLRGDPRRQAVRAGVSDDAALAWRDGFTSIIAPEDGKYIIQVRESAYSGNGGCLYRLHVGNFPRATAVMPAGGKPGETLAVRWIGDAAGETTSTIKLPADVRARLRHRAPGRQGLVSLSQRVPAHARWAT